MQVQPYLFFDGRCEEALDFYKKTLGAKVDMLMRFKEAPDQSMVAPGSGEKVMHCAFCVGDTQVLASDGRTRWKKGGQKTPYSGKQLWWSNHQPGFKELLDTRGSDDVASPLGEWTRVECICDRDTITIKINGVTVNQCFDVQPAAGKILLQNESNEIYFRNVELRPLDR